MNYPIVMSVCPNHMPAKAFHARLQILMTHHLLRGAGNLQAVPVDHRALANRMDGRKNRVYTVMGDGELAEGSVWEGFMAGGPSKGGNPLAGVDRASYSSLVGT